MTQHLFVNTGRKTTSQQTLTHSCTMVTQNEGIKHSHFKDQIPTTQKSCQQSTNNGSTIESLGLCRDRQVKQDQPITTKGGSKRINQSESLELGRKGYVKHNQPIIVNGAGSKRITQSESLGGMVR